MIMPILLTILGIIFIVCLVAASLGFVMDREEMAIFGSIICVFAFVIGILLGIDYLAFATDLPHWTIYTFDAGIGVVLALLLLFFFGKALQ